VALAYGLTLAPGVVQVEVAPGKSQTFRLKVYNQSAKPMPLRTYAWDYWYGDSGRQVSPPGTTPRSAAAWVEMVPRSVVAAPKAWTEFLGTVSAPADASGGYLATLFVATDTQQSSDAQVRAMAASRIGAVLMVHVEGTGTYGLDIGDPTFHAPTETAPATITLTAHNTGTVQVPVSLKLAVRGTDGEVLGSVTSDTVHWALPGETITVAATWSTPMAPGAYQVVGAVFYGDDRTAPFVHPLVVPAAPEAPSAP